MDILNNRYITYDKIKAFVEPKGNDLNEFGVNYGDVLFQRSSETLEDVGRANVYLDKKTALFGGFVIRGKKIGEYNPLFFRYLLSSPHARKRIVVKGAGAQHFNIGQDGLSKISIFVPTTKEQERIAKLLDLIDERIETQNRIIEDLKQLRSALIENMYSHMPTKCKVGDAIMQVSMRNRDNTYCTVLSVNNRRKFIEQSEQFEDRIVASDDTSNYKVVKRNDFAYNPARINVGSIARLTTFEDGIVSPMYICFQAKQQILPEYLEYFFYTRYFHNEMLKRLEGSVRMCLSWDSLCNIPLTIPNIEQQRVVSRRISILTDKIIIEEKYKEYLMIQKHYLLKAMFI